MSSKTFVKVPTTDLLEYSPNKQIISIIENMQQHDSKLNDILHRRMVPQVYSNNSIDKISFVDNTSDYSVQESKLVTQLTMQNKQLREDLRQSQQQVFQLQSDLEMLRQTMEDHLPYFNELEIQNKQYKMEI